ncbi:MAG: succinate dehydrogenase assembly factor 2 [Gammaproteobacteria bacterium]|nr:succinate dehydrogenase assembly factor 2 [Gammaproteobacteria bacterium]
MKELDVILERYYQRNYAAASAAEREAFVALLQQEDPAIWAWTMGYEVAPAPFADVIQQLRRYA